MLPEEYIKKMTELSLRKFALLKEMLVLTKGQANAISHQDIDSLQRLTGDKQGRIDSINKLDDEFQACFLKLKQVLKVDKLREIKDGKIAGAKELQSAIGQVMSLVKEISDIEKRNNADVKKMMDATALEIKKINQGKVANNAYKSGIGKAPSYFIDSKK